MTLSDPERRGVRGQNFMADLHSNGLTKNDRIWHGNRRGRSVFLYHVPIYRGRGPSVPQNFGTSYTRGHSMRKFKQLGDHAVCEENFCNLGDHER